MTALTLGLALASARPASAQTEATGFALGRFQPAASGGRWFALDSLDARGHLQPSASLLLDWGHKPLVIYGGDGSERTALVENQAVLHLGASLDLWQKLRLSLDVPFAAFQNGTDGQLGGMLYRAPGSAGLGDVRLGADLYLGGRPGEPVRLAVGLQAFAPTGAQDQYLSDGKMRLSPRVLLAGDAGPWTWAAELGFDYRALSAAYDGAPVGSGIRLGAAAGWQGLDGKLVVGPEIYGTTSSDGFLERRTTALEGLFGARYRIAGDLVAGLGVGTGLSRGLGTPRARGVASIAWAPSGEPAAAAPPSDTDSDGIVDLDDACPDRPGEASDDLLKNGCPPSDRDGDAIADRHDLCPDQAAGPRPDPAKKGCPLPPDRDEDGIPDAADRCPEEKGVAATEPERHGCPPDADRDGIPDLRDACPKVPGVAASEPAINGCPPDADRDAVVDAEDFCPTEPAGARPDPTRSGCPFRDQDDDGVADLADNCPSEKGPAANQGCPARKKQLVVITSEKLEIKEKVFFATGKSRILPKSFGLLDQVARVLGDHQEIARIQVEGHTDDRGKAEANRALSQARADAVRNYLVGKGIAVERLVARGFGPDRPADTNATPAGRENNRRVEFTIAGPATQTQTIEVESDLAPLTPPKPGSPVDPQAPMVPASPKQPKAAAEPAAKPAGTDEPAVVPLTPLVPNRSRADVTETDVAPLAPLAPLAPAKPKAEDELDVAPLAPPQKAPQSAGGEPSLAPLAPLVPGGSR